MGMKAKVELRIVINEDGIRGVQVTGPSEVQMDGHDIYLKIRHLIPLLDKEIQKLLQNGGLDVDEKGHTER